MGEVCTKAKECSTCDDGKESNLEENKTLNNQVTTTEGNNNSSRANRENNY